MEKADKILTNAVVLTMDGMYHIYNPGALAIRDADILAVGPQEDITSSYTADEVVDCGGKVLLPGLINTHTHVPMTLLRGLADDLRLDVWLMGYMMPVERQFVTPEFVKLGTRIACAEFIRTGVTCFNDMYYFEDAVAEATAEVGLRALVTQTVMKFPAPDAPSYEVSLGLCEELIRKWKGNPLIVPGLAPHAVYTTTPEILSAITKMALEHDVPVHFHVAETESEVSNLRMEQGIPVIPYVRRFGLLDTKMVAAHCVWVDEGEARTMQHANVGIAHNPSSNLKLSSGIAPVKRMLDLNCNVGIGTDGPASNNDLDMIEEMRLASMIAKVSTGDPTALPARQVLAMATCIGAKAIHMGDIIGSLVPGKRADVILIDLTAIHNQPHFHRDPNGIYAQIVYAAKATDVTDVMVNGKWMMVDRKLTTIDEAQLIAEARVMAQQIDDFLKNREESVLSKLVAIGGASEEESFEVQAKISIKDLTPVTAALTKPEIEIVRVRHYHEFDTYFSFRDPSQGRLRYREDEFLGENGRVESVRSRLTLIGETRDDLRRENGEAFLSRSRYLAPAVHSLRFYNEYFKPERSIEIEKDRLRYLIRYKGIEFFVNLDTIQKPFSGKFVEVKSRTWSRQDADNKLKLMQDLLLFLGLDPSAIVTEDYVHLVEHRLGLSD